MTLVSKGKCKTALASDHTFHVLTIIILEENVKGLQDTLLQQNFSWDIPTSEFVQVLHDPLDHY